MSPRILVPLDDSPQSWDAFRHVLEAHPNAAITVLNVINPVNTLLKGEVYGGETPRIEAEAENIQTEAEEIADAFDVTVSTAIESGRPARVIPEYAQDHDIDHIVMGSHGRGGGARILLGSVAETVVRRAEMPVTIYR